MPKVNQRWRPLAGVVLATLVAGLPAAGMAESRLDRLLRNRSTMGVWLTNSPSKLYYDRKRIRASMRQLQEAGVQSRGAQRLEPRHHLPSQPFRTFGASAQKAGLGIDPICTLAAEGRRRGIKVMPWFEYGLMEPADAAVVRDNPSWVLAKANGQRWMTMHGNHRMAWLNPAHPEVRARFIGLVVETLKRCPMDGLNWTITSPGRFSSVMTPPPWLSISKRREWLHHGITAIDSG